MGNFRHGNGTVYCDIEMASHCFRASPPITTYIVNYGYGKIYSTATNLRILRFYEFISSYSYEICSIFKFLFPQTNILNKYLRKLEVILRGFSLIWMTSNFTFWFSGMLSTNTNVSASNFEQLFTIGNTQNRKNQSESVNLLKSSQYLSGDELCDGW
jgi:hypothetical protein